MDNSRTSNTLKNTLWSFLSQGVTILMGLVSRKFFLDILGAELLGVNSLFADVLSIFSFADLGFGVAITFSLYEPIAQNNTPKIQSLLKFFQIIYYYVMGALVLIALLFYPYLRFIKTEIPLNELTVYYVLYILTSLLSYICVYRETYATACQQQRKISQFNTLFTVLQVIFQVILIYLTESFLIYLITALLMSAIKKVVINIYLAKRYPFTKLKKASLPEKETRNRIQKDAFAILVHKIGNLAINQTDSMIVSSFVSVTQWGYMSTYILIKASFSRVADQIYSAVLPSLGNLVADSEKENHLRVFFKYDCLNYFFSAFCFVILGNVSSGFISLYFGKEYILDPLTIFIFSLSFYISCLQYPVSAMREACGVFQKDKWYTILAAFINLVVSLALVVPFGVSGVFVGTICSILTLLVSRVIILLKKHYHDSCLPYFKTIGHHIITGFVTYGATYYVNLLITEKMNSWEILEFLAVACSSVIVCGITLILLNLRNQAFMNLFQEVKNKLAERTQHDR